MIHDGQYTTIKAAVFASECHRYFLIFKQFNTLAELFIMNFKVFSVLALMALVFVYTTTADPAAEEHVTEMAKKPEHASEDHAAAGKADVTPSHHVKKMKDEKKHEPSHHAHEEYPHHSKMSKGYRAAPKDHHSKKTKHVEAAH